MSPAATAHSTRYALGPCKKFVATRRDFIRSDIDPKLAWFLIQIEDRAMDRTLGFDHPWGIVYDADLKNLGSEDTIRRLWLKAEQGGYLQRVQIKDASGHVTGRIGFVWYCRPSDHPVATPATFDQAAADLRRAIAGRNQRARTVPMRPRQPETPRSFAGGRPAVLRGDAPQFCGADGGAPYSNRARGLEEENTEKTTTTRAELSSSFSTSSPTQTQEPERPEGALPFGLVAVEPIPTAAAPNHVQPENLPVASELPAELVIDQALLSIAIVRMIALSAHFKHAPNWSAAKARDFILGLVRLFRCPLWWVHNAIEQAHQRRDPARGKKAVEKAVYVRNTVERWTKGDGDPGEEPAIGKPSGQEPPTRASPSRRNEARQVLDALRGCGLDIEARRAYCEDTSQTTWSYARSQGDWSRVDASLKRKLEELKPEIRELVRLETEARHAVR